MMMIVVTPTFSPPSQKQQHSRQVPQLVILFQAFQILLFNQLINGFLDIRYARLKPRAQLCDSLRNQDLMLHLLAGFHDAYDGGLQGVSLRISFKRGRKESVRLTCIRSFLSSSMVLCVSSTSCLASDLTVMLRFTLTFLFLKL